MEHIKGIISNLWSFPGWKKRLKAAEVLAKWEEIVGPRIAKAARPKGFSQGVVIIEVEDSIWMNRLHFEEKRLLNLLNKEASEEIFTQIRWVLTRRPFRKKEFLRDVKDLPEEIKRKIGQEVKVIQDKEVRNAFFALRLTLAKKAQKVSQPLRYKNR